MNKFVLILFFTSQFTYGNGWEKLGNGFDQFAQTIYIDTTTNKIYAGGRFHLADSVAVNGIAMWNGSFWDSLGRGNTFTWYNQSIIKYNNQIYSDGRYTLNNMNYGGVFNGTFWDSIGNGFNGQIEQMKIVNNNLIVAGFYDNFDGNQCQMITSFDGNNWNCINSPYSNEIRDFTYFQSNLVIAGNFFESGVNNIDLALYDSSGWHTIGHPIYGSFSAISALAIFNNELYVGGYFLQADGNEANHIMRWDGSQWQSLGTGTDNEVKCLTVFNNELYVGGIFDYAGGIHTGGLAKWDGSSWHQVSPSIIFDVEAMEFWNSDLYIVGGFQFIDTLRTNYVAKYSGISNKIDKVELLTFSVYPTITSDYLSFNLPDSRSYDYLIYSGDGCIQMSGVIRNNDTINISSFADGIYFVQLRDEASYCLRKFIKSRINK